METISLDPLPMEQWEKLSERERQLQAIGDNVAYWIKWVARQHEAEGLETTPDTHIMLPGENRPPYWPSVGQLTRWLTVLREGAA
jgi:hypothetical protein